MTLRLPLTSTCTTKALRRNPLGPGLRRDDDVETEGDVETDGSVETEGDVETDGSVETEGDVETDESYET